MAADPAFTTAFWGRLSDVTGPNTERTWTGTQPLSELLEPRNSGGLLRRIEIQGVGTVTAGMVRLWISLSGNVNGAVLWREIPVTATTPSASVPGWSRTIECGDMPFPALFALYGSSHNAETFDVLVTAAYL